MLDPAPLVQPALGLTSLGGFVVGAMDGISEALGSGSADMDALGNGVLGIGEVDASGIVDIDASGSSSPTLVSALGGGSAVESAAPDASALVIEGSLVIALVASGSGLEPSALVTPLSFTDVGGASAVPEVLERSAAA